MIVGEGPGQKEDEIGKPFVGDAGKLLDKMLKAINIERKNIQYGNIKYINLKVVKNPTKINELLIFFSIVAGLSTFGFWGMIIGPAMVTFFISIMQLLKKYSNDVI